MSQEVAESKPRKPRRIPQAPAGDFHRGEMLWMPSMLTWAPKLTFTVPFKPPSLNELNQLRAIDARRQGHHGYNDFKTRWEDVIRHCWVTTCWQAGQTAPRRLTGAFRAQYLYICADRRSDVSNLHAAFEKILLDALVSAGALPGDRFAHHRGSSYEAEHTPGKWGVVVTLTECDPQAEPVDRRKAIGMYRRKNGRPGCFNRRQK